MLVACWSVEASGGGASSWWFNEHIALVPMLSSRVAGFTHTHTVFIRDWTRVARPTATFHNNVERPLPPIRNLWPSAGITFAGMRREMSIRANKTTDGGTDQKCEEFSGPRNARGGELAWWERIAVRSDWTERAAHFLFSAFVQYVVVYFMPILGVGFIFGMKWETRKSSS